MSDDQFSESTELVEIEVSGMPTVRPSGDLDAFAAFEHNYLLQYIYLGDIRGAAIFAALGSAMGFYFTRPVISPSTETVLFDVLTLLWLVFNIIGFTLAGVALCPFPSRSRVPRRAGVTKTTKKQAERRDAHLNEASITHYFDVASFDDSDEYIAQVAKLHGQPIELSDGLAREKLRECYQLAVILKGKMACIYWSFIMSATALASLIIALGFVGVGKAPSLLEQFERVTHLGTH